MAKILLVEDDKSLCVVISNALELEHNSVEISQDGIDALERLKAYAYDLIILDWNLPFLQGISICQQFRAMGGSSPILMLTAKATLDDKESGFQSGADDYLTKPFELRELKVRVKALLRRSHNVKQDILTAGDLKMDVAQFRVTKNGVELHLSPKEFALLEYFLRNPKKVHGAENLLLAVWRAEEDAGKETVRAHIKNLRAKVDTPGGPSILSTVFGVGYKLNIED